MVAFVCGIVIIILQEVKIGHYPKHEEREVKADSGTVVSDLHGMQFAECSGQTDSRKIQSQAMGSCNHTQEGSSGRFVCVGTEGKTGTEATACACGGTGESQSGTAEHQRCIGRCRARAILAKKKSGLNLEGHLKGHFSIEVKQKVVLAIKESILKGVSQKTACSIIGIDTRKYRRWANPKPLNPRTAWNKILPHERDAVIQTAWDERFWDKPISHIYVYGNDSGRFFMSLSSVYRILKSQKLVKEQSLKRKRQTSYIDAHTLLDNGFSLLCYDATRFVTNSGLKVWALPVFLLPSRFLLHIGYAVNGVNGADLENAVSTALSILPNIDDFNLIAHSDRGSAMKADCVKKLIKNTLNAPVHYGRPHTPDDEPWIEALIKNLKYHRDVPDSFNSLAELNDWFAKFTDIYNNEPHSALSYVSPMQALLGLKDSIISQRKSNLALAKSQRYVSWLNANSPCFSDRSLIVSLSTT